MSTTVLAGGGLYQVVQYAVREDDKIDADGRPVRRFKPGDQIGLMVRPRMEKGVPVVQKLSGELL